ncbi:NYN domain-containing protein [Conexibacter sp. DBS9H8]|uniref:NYN domain-containing protein n=1 Tax=Conexibacter sp. DBS9H8 TaxID=2937801 RepID=UPI00200D0EF0|nr:NYN domain-containing protein [Conexibacter sp. DBS9H8]
MKVGVYIDGFNLYYGARGLCGRGTPGWRWINLRSLASALCQSTSWSDISIERIVYCTARISGADNPGGARDQDIYLKALVAAQSVDHIEYGTYVSRVKRAPLALPDAKGRPILTRAAAPVLVKDSSDNPVHDAVFLVSHAQREEKGSDVNVAAHLLLDVLEGSVEAALVISNDSDLKLPIVEARKRVPVGLVNPSKTQTAGDLRGEKSDGVGGHWWHRLRANEIRAHQLADPVGSYGKPQGW